MISKMLMLHLILLYSRAGATAISEILFLKKPSILIPYPYASDNHQEINAKVLEKRCSCMIKENEFKTYHLKKRYSSCLNQEKLWMKISLNASKLSSPNASVYKDKIKEIISC